MPNLPIISVAHLVPLLLTVPSIATAAPPTNAEVEVNLNVMAHSVKPLAFSANRHR